METAGHTYKPSNNESYMNQQQKRFFRDKLIQWREQLLDDNKKSLERIRSARQEGGDLIDRSVEDKNKVFEFITRRRNEEAIKKINAALRRLDDGSFGYCLESGEEIGLDRLLAYPVATLTIDVQELLENRQPRAMSSDMVM